LPEFTRGKCDRHLARLCSILCIRGPLHA